MWRIRGRLFSLPEHLLCGVKVKGDGRGRGSSLQLILVPGLSKSELHSSRLLEDDITRASFPLVVHKSRDLKCLCLSSATHSFPTLLGEGLRCLPKVPTRTLPWVSCEWGSWSHVNTCSSISLGVCCCASWVNILTFYPCATFSLRQEKESLSVLIFSI